MNRVLQLVLTAFLSLVSCGAFATERQTVVVWGVSIGPDSKGLEAVIREFERTHPKYKIRVLSMGAGGMNPQKLMTSIVGKVPPDAVAQDRFTISDWASRGAFMPLDDLIARDPDAPKKEQYYSAVWSEASYEGKVYGIPTGADDRVLYYNKAIFHRKAAELRAAGLDPERPPNTWSEVLAYSKVLTEHNKDGTLRVAGFLPNFGNSWLYLYSFQMNGTFMSPDGRKCTLDSPENETALKFMKDGYDILGGYALSQTFSSGFQGNENDAFIIGKVAMKIDGDWIINGIARYGPQLDFGVAPPPVPDDRFNQKGAFAHEKEKFVTWTGGFAYAIPTGARNVEGAWEFIKYASSTEGRLLSCRAQREAERQRGRLYVSRLAGQIETNQRIIIEFAPSDPRIAAALKQHVALLPNGRIRPATFAGQPLWDEHARAIEIACLGTMPVKDALLAGQAAVQRELDDHFREDSLTKVNFTGPLLGLAALAILGLGSAWWFVRRMKLGKIEKSEAKWAYLFIGPWLIGFVVLTLGPMIASLIFSFTQYNVLSDAHWNGIENYRALVTTDWPNVSKAITNILYLAAVGVPLNVFTGLAIALLLNNAVKAMRFYRTIFYMPAIVPITASAVLWIWVLTPDPNKGLLNAGYTSTIGSWFGITPPGWLNVPDWSKPGLVLMGVWGAGSGMLLWLAGLKGIPTQLYEASSIDGASPSRQLWSITLPQLSPVIFFNVVIGFIGAVQEFDRVFIMKPADTATAGPSDSLLTPVYHLFTNGFNYFKMGYASSLAWMIFVVILGLTLIQFRLAPRWVHYENER